MFNFLKNLLSGSNEGEIKKLQPLVKRINELEPEMKKLTDAEMK